MLGSNKSVNNKWIKRQGKWIVGIVAYLIFTFLWNVYLAKQENYTALHDWKNKTKPIVEILESKVKALESYHAN